MKPQAPLPDEETNYLMEVVGHPVSVSGLLGAVTAGAALSMVAGFGPAAIPLLLWVSAETIAGLFLPSSPVFREWIDRKKRAERREALRTQLLERIRTKSMHESFQGSRLHGQLIDYREQYDRMRERVAQIAKLAAQQSASISSYDLEKLDDATVDFLRLVHARVVLHERMDAQDMNELDRQLRIIDKRLEQAEGAVERKKLEMARADLERVLTRRRGLPAQDVATATQLLSITEAVEELYHHVTTDAGGAEVGRFLQEATARINLQEEIALEVDEEMDAIARKTRARQAGAERGM